MSASFSLPTIIGQTGPSTTIVGGAAEQPTSTAGALVFFFVCGVIVAGALILYLRNRPSRA